MNESPIDLARRLNTLNKRDRSAQYTDASGPALLKSNNHLWVRIRVLHAQLWALGLIISAQGAVIAWLAHELLSRLK